MGIYQGKNNFLHCKGNKVRRQLIEWEKIFVNFATETGLISRICKEFQKLNNNRAIQLSNRQRDFKKAEI